MDGGFEASWPLVWLICVVSLIISPGLANAKALAIEESTKNGPSTSYATGVTLGVTLFSKMSADSSMFSSSNCMDRISDELNQQLRSTAGFRADMQLLAQITDLDKREKVCRLWKGQQQYIQDCEQELNESASKNARSTGLMALIGVICNEEMMRVVEQNAFCFGDTEQALQQRCIDACRNQSGMPIIKPDQLAKHSKSIENPETICKIGICSIRCLSAQIQECEENGNEIKDLYNALSSAQMLLGMEKAASESAALSNNSSSASRLILSLFKNSKMPSKCQLFVQKSWEKTNAQAQNNNNDEQAKNKNMF